MPTVLHVIDAASDQATPTTLALLAEALGRLGDVRQHVLLLGGRSLRELAQTLGIKPWGVVGVPGGKALWGWPRSAIALRRAIHHLHVDVVHAWSVGAFTLSALVARQTPRLLTVTAPPGPAAVKWLRLLMGETADAGRPTLLPISNTLRRDLLQGGVAQDAVHVLRPGLDQARVPHSARAMLRERWGVQGDQVKVLALLGDPWHGVDAHLGVMAAGLANEIYAARAAAGAGANQPRLRVLLHPDQHNRRRVEQMLAPLGLIDTVIREKSAARPWEVLPGCDMALALGPGAGGLATLWAMAANVPILGEATYAVSEVLEDRHSALLAKPDQPKLLAHRITQLLDDRLLTWKLRDTARHEAYSFFSRQRYCQSLLAVYQSVIEGRPVQVQDLPVTGGLRFSGRA
jgi:hypothetical protein